MGLQYIGAEKFTGDSGAYLFKKGRLKRKSIEAMTTKLYRRKSLRESILSMIYGKIDNIDRIKDMICNAKNLACMELWVMPLPYPIENETWEFTQVTALSLLMTSIFTPPIWINTLIPCFRFQKRDPFYADNQ